MTTLMLWNGWGGCTMSFGNIPFLASEALWGCLPHAGGGRASPWATASRWPQNANPSQLCPQSLPSASHLAIPKHWLESGSPSKHLRTCCPKATQQSPAARPAVAWLRWCSKVGATQTHRIRFTMNSSQIPNVAAKMQAPATLTRNQANKP